ncbi:hypothetical protein CPB84DRAFT_1847916 [Gymnopilus junonius]|uniref:Nucleosome assembly protein n=1 Tax=Gymnopilus junonius TaxID=109634 RepID=A0A9P5NLV8_GYMJU|nr:hypothetical protein CPB84DRAFT_1847916 [Gymnopilus junonius]
MSSNVPISGAGDITAPTPQNTPLNQAPIALGLSRPTVPDISEENEGENAAEEGTDASPLAGIEEHMLGMVHGRLADLLGKSSGYIESLPVEIKLNVEALKGVQVKQNELHQQYKKECLELEKKYLELQKPLYERRSAIINGKAAATPEEIQAGEAASAKEEDEEGDYTPLPKDVTPSPSGIPEFWLTSLRNHVALNELITDRDAQALKHLKDVRLQYLKEGDAATDKETKGKPGFKIIFEFEKNDFFDNELLEKTYLYQEEVGYSGDFVYDRAIGTVIQWKEDKDLTKEFEIKKQRNKNTNRTQGIENGDYDEEELEELEEKLEEDYQIGEDLKEKIIPRAIDYFTGKALQYEMLEEDDDDDFDLEEEEDDEDRFEDESESEDDVPVRRRGGVAGRGGKAGAGQKNVNPEECKQQ